MNSGYADAGAYIVRVCVCVLIWHDIAWSVKISNRDSQGEFMNCHHQMVI